MNLRLEPYERETSGKAKKIQAVVTDSKTRKEMYQEWFMNRIIYIFLRIPSSLDFSIEIL